MKLQTVIPISKEKRNQINYNSKVFLIGSCFSENIGSKFDYYKFQITKNPIGILFHPIAIENFITASVNKDFVTKENLVFQNELWHSFDSHSSLSSENESDILSNINTAISNTNRNLKEASHIIITLGTSWVYRHIETDKIVANCHKIPQKKFLKELLSVDEVSESLRATISIIKEINPSVTILFTISPVRHLKDGFTENQQSKAHLISAVHQTIDDKDKIHYFPCYEIMMDELRDYRFYSEDMIHPNKLAIDYIWDKFISAWFSEDNLSTMKEIDIIQKSLAHKPFNPKSEEFLKFSLKLEDRKQKIKEKYAFIDF